MLTHFTHYLTFDISDMFDISNIFEIFDIFYISEIFQTSNIFDVFSVFDFKCFKWLKSFMELTMRVNTFSSVYPSKLNKMYQMLYVYWIGILSVLDWY